MSFCTISEESEYYAFIMTIVMHATTEIIETE